jgi:uncharacterized protein
MWIERDLLHFLRQTKDDTLPVKVLRGPRQVGKTSLLDRLKTHKLVLFDDLGVRNLAESNPSLFFEQFTGPLILDEATLAPQIFPEIKMRVDKARRDYQKTGKPISIDIWITGSNQTLLQKAVRESLAGRANYYFLNTLSVHEMQSISEQPFKYADLFMRGGWPELYANYGLDPVRYLNDFISTFIEKDIVGAAGIEKKAAFIRALQLISGRIGQLFVFSDISKSVGVDTTTIQAWVSLFEQNGILKLIPPFYSNLNQRLIKKTPKIFFDDVGLAVRLQGWSQYDPLVVSPYFGNLFENLALIEIARFFTNKGKLPEIYFVRSKERVEIDFLIQLPNHRFLAVEVKTSPCDFTQKQIKLLDSLQIEIIDRWVISNHSSHHFSNSKVITIDEIFHQLEKIYFC